jgi:hypothetical protein
MIAFPDAKVKLLETGRDDRDGKEWWLIDSRLISTWSIQ